MFIFNIEPLDVGLLPPRRGLNQDKSLCVFSSQDHLKTGMCNVDHPVLTSAENTDKSGYMSCQSNDRVVQDAIPPLSPGHAYRYYH
jgi:hypothetical protein